MSQPDKQPESNFRGLYRHVKISVPTLNKVIIGGIAAIILVLIVGLRSPGYTVSFNCTGGTPVESQKLMYGELIDPPQPPTREGFRFVGWYTDENGNYPWNLETDPVSQPMTLYAVWEPVS